ncbi:MAG: DUF4340 domain-containing protein [Candidatus Hydrogenedentes bacterium]|nr:DUF4340 domain-containing protein [Candidatus Hydrogenedentota bacterium]
MKQKYVTPLAVIFAILLVLVVVKQVRKPKVTITDQVKLAALVPEGLTKADITKLELYAGGKPDAKVTLQRSDSDPNVWAVTSHFNAPADTEKIEKFVEQAIGLRGEVRDSGAGDAAIDSYNLKDEKAFHVKGYKKGEEAPAVDVLIGKAPAMDQVLVRAANSSDVYMLDTNLRREAGLFQDEPDAEPKADNWLKKDVVKIAKDTISKIVVTTPDKRLVVAKETKEVPVEDPAKPEDAAADATPTAGEPLAEAAKKEEEANATAEGENKEDKPATKKEVKWVLAEGGTGLEVKQSGVENLAGAFATVTASDVVDPAKLADWGLETPQFSVAITVEGKEGDVVIEGGRPDPNGDGYVRVASANKDVIFKMSKFAFEKIFPKGTDMFTLKGLTLDKAQIAKVDLSQPSGNISITKQGEEWTINAPSADLAAQKSTLDAIGNVLSAWTPSDYADKPDGAGLEAPTHTAVVTMASGEQHTLVLGAPSKGIAGQYARLDNAPNVLVMSKGDVDRAFPPAKDVYQRALLDIDEAEVNSISIERADDPFQLARAGEGWTLSVGGAAAEANPEACEDLLSSVAELEASDIVFGQADLGVEPIATLHCVMKDGSDHVFRFGPEENGSQALALSGKAQVFKVEKLTAEEVLVTSASLKKAEPVPAPAAEATAIPDAGTPPAPAAVPADAIAPAPMPAEPAVPEVAPAPDTAAPAPAAAPAGDASADALPAPAESPAPAPSESAAPTEPPVAAAPSP